MTFRTATLALALLAAATPGLADPAEWLPAPINLPADHEVLSERSIGSGTHMATLTVTQDPSDLLDEWAESLRSGSFTVDLSMRDDDRLLFSGPGGVSGQIAVRRPPEGGAPVIAIDMSGG